MAVLYRKYRPGCFSQVLGQEPIVHTLLSQIKSGNFAHAYLFTGSRGVGKTSVARIFAKAVNCIESKDGDACNNCENCKALAAGAFLDLVEIDAASNTGVDNIRDLIEHVKFTPVVGRCKIFIIDEVHMLSKGAFNALLKTLEEPPKHAVFILATTEINKVPPTVISRTQRFDFKPYVKEELLKLLQGVAEKESFFPETGVLELVAESAEGGARDALSLLEKLFSLGSQPALQDCRRLLGAVDEELFFRLMKLISTGSSGELPSFFEQVSQDGVDFTAFCRGFLDFLRKVLVAKISGLGQSNYVSIAQTNSANEIIFFIRLFLKAFKDLPVAPDAQVPLLLAALEAAFKKYPAVGSQTAYAAQPPEIKKNENSPVDQPKDYLSPQQAVESAMLQGEAKEPKVSEDQVRELWPKVIEKVRQINGPLASMLRSAVLAGVNGSTIILEVKFLFNKQNLENPRNLPLVLEQVLEVLGENLSLSVRLQKITENQVTNNAVRITDALKIFGGELVE